MVQYEIYRIKICNVQCNQSYSFVGYDINEAYRLVAQWNEEDKYRGDEYEVRESKNDPI